MAAFFFFCAELTQDCGRFLGPGVEDGNIVLKALASASLGSSYIQ